MDYDKLTRKEIVSMCQTLWQKNAALEQNIELYREQLKKNEQKMYGKSSEKSSLVLQNEMDLFDEADTLPMRMSRKKQSISLNINVVKRKNTRWITYQEILKRNIVIMIWEIRIVRHAEVDYIKSVLTKN